MDPIHNPRYSIRNTQSTPFLPLLFSLLPPSSLIPLPSSLIPQTLSMPTLIPSPSVVESAGTKPKRIEEYVGRVNTGHDTVSVARMTSPGGWEEPGQRPEFDEVTLVLRGRVRVEHEDGSLDVEAGQAVLTRAGEWIRYSTPDAEGAEYVAICLPAFSPDRVHRDDEE